MKENEESYPPCWVKPKGKPCGKPGYLTALIQGKLRPVCSKHQKQYDSRKQD